jgi:hypothetical protein
MEEKMLLRIMLKIEAKLRLLTLVLNQLRKARKLLEL